MILLSKAEGMAARTGEAGYSNRDANKHADIIKRPSSAASLKYSGQH